jgi:hypothetical protein
MTFITLRRFSSFQNLSKPLVLSVIRNNSVNIKAKLNDPDTKVK